MGETNKQKRLITVPETNKNYKGLGFDRWDAFIADFIEKHPDYEQDNTPPAIGKKGKRK